MTGTEYRCPVCGHHLWVYVAVWLAPTCTHRNTPHDARRAARMERAGE